MTDRRTNGRTDPATEMQGRILNLRIYLLVSTYCQYHLPRQGRAGGAEGNAVRR